MVCECAAGLVRQYLSQYYGNGTELEQWYLMISYFWEAYLILFIVFRQAFISFIWATKNWGAVYPTVTD